MRHTGTIEKDQFFRLDANSDCRGAAEALENVNLISEGVLSEYLRSVLELSLPKVSKKKKVVLGVQDKNLAGSIKANFSSVECETGDTSEVDRKSVV